MKRRVAQLPIIFIVTISFLLFNGRAGTAHAGVTLAGTSDTTTYRTATYRDWADAMDQKGKRKSVRCKPDGLRFKFTLRVPRLPLTLEPDTLLYLSFNIPIQSLTVTGGGPSQVPICNTLVFDAKHLVANLNFGCQDSVRPGDTLQFDGHSSKAKLVRIGYRWLKADQKVILAGTLPNPNAPHGDTLTENTTGIPLPNLHNVGEDIYGGVRKTSVDITVGTTSDPKGAHTVYHPMYKDVLKSLVKVVNGAAVYHTELPHCLDAFDKNGRPISKRQKSLPPDKQNNRLFAEQLVLKLNIAASDSGDFPQGLGDLIYDDRVFAGVAGPLDGLTLRAIVDSVDRYLGCNGPVAGTDDPTEFLRVDSLVNVAFAGPFDTISWNCAKVVTRGVRPLSEVPYLHQNPSAPPAIWSGHGPSTWHHQQPVGFELRQNYPNPFNPQTTIEFTLPEAGVVTLKVYNVLGQEVSKLLDRESMDDGVQEVDFDAAGLPSGVYFYRIEVRSIIDEQTGELGPTRTSVKKMMLVR